MFMALPFVKLDDIDCCFEELKDTKPEIDEEDKKIDFNILEIHGSAINVILIDLYEISLTSTHLEPIILVKLIIIK